MKRFIKLFLLLCSWALVAIVSAAILMLVSAWIAGSTESVLFSAVFFGLDHFGLRCDFGDKWGGHMKGKNAPPNVAASSGAGRTNLTTRYCVRAYCSTRERKRQ